VSGGVARLVELLDGLAPDLQRRAFTHNSWTEDRTQSFERLAFLGDAVLGMMMAELLLDSDAAATAGDLTKIRAQAASRAACARVSEEMGVKDRLAMQAPTEAELPVEDVINAQSVLAEVCEAVIGACFRQYGYEATRAAVAEAFAAEITDAIAHPGDFKSRLQEFLARSGRVPEYIITDAEGPAHERSFVSVVEIRGDRYGTGTGRSKKEAEQAAAQATLEMLEPSSGPA
jgi:ribonuclease-3